VVLEESEVCESLSVGQEEGEEEDVDAQAAIEVAPIECYQEGVEGQEQEQEEEEQQQYAYVDENNQQADVSILIYKFLILNHSSTKIMYIYVYLYTEHNSSIWLSRFCR